MYIYMCVCVCVYMYTNIYTQMVRDGVVGNISPCHGDARGSIPRRGEYIVKKSAPIVQWLEFVPSKHEVRVRFPVGAVNI